MIQEQELKLPQGSLHYELHQGADGKQEVMITRISGLMSELVIPQTIAGCCVTGIGRKAFLSRKQLRSVTLPATVRELGDWAFAYCSNLEQVVLPGRKVAFGRSLFLDCKSLKKVVVSGKKEISELMAVAVTVLEAYYLLDPVHAGSEEWLSKWDARLKAYLAADDHDGYSRQVLCGEEDYGSTDLEAFLSNKRKGKVRLCYLRLLHDVGLSDGLRCQLEQYLLEHTSGCKGEEAWQVLLTEYGEERSYYELFAGIGCANEANFDSILLEIGEEHPEMKAYFLRFKEEKLGYEDFFDGLSLDL